MWIRAILQFFSMLPTIFNQYCLHSAGNPCLNTPLEAWTFNDTSSLLSRWLGTVKVFKCSSAFRARSLVQWSWLAMMRDIRQNRLSPILPLAAVIAGVRIGLAAAQEKWLYYHYGRDRTTLPAPCGTVVAYTDTGQPVFLPSQLA